jgi:fermentation-respiration switch protein FrsA (DUF1100 family)
MSQNKDFYLNGVIIESTFTSISDMADQVFPFLAKLPCGLKDKMTKLQWKSIDKVPDIKFPLLYISGDKDSFVPTWMTQQLYDRSESAPLREILIVPGGDHNNTFIVAAGSYTTKLSTFFRKCRMHYKRGLESTEPESPLASLRPNIK